MADSRKEYVMVVGGIEHVVLYTPEEAERLGLKAVAAPPNKAVPAPRNKAVS